MTGSRKRIVYGVLGVLAVIFFVPGMCSSREHASLKEYNYNEFVKPNEAKIRAALIARLDEGRSPVCARTPRFPYDSSRTAERCELCDELVDAGLLEKSVVSEQRGDATVPVARFDLTAAGRPLYTETLREGTFRDRPGLCFGSLVLHDMTLRIAASFQGQVHVDYVLRVENPHEILFGPHAKTLGLPPLQHGLNGALLPPAQRDAWVPNGVFQSLQ